MIFERVKSEGLAHNSYFFGSGSTAAVIDPRRDVKIYLDLAIKHGFKIKYIFETHRNEDYVIGSLELADETHADVYHGPGLEWKYGNILKDGHEFRLGKLNLIAIQTPGHTDESMSYVLTDLSSGKAPVMIFTGDTLFVGDTGRVDLYGMADIPRMASNLYDSLFKRLLTLGDSVILCPAHGSGSVCGINISDRDESSLGIERIQNPALQFTNKADFIRYKAAEQPEKPPYFSKMEQYNKDGPPRLKFLPAPAPLTAVEFKEQMEKDSVVVDTSLPSAFGGAHIKGSYSIWLEGLPGFAGWMLLFDKPILLVLQDQGQLEKAILYLVRIGYDRVTGFLKDGIEGWYNAGLPIESLPLLSVHQLKEMLDKDASVHVLDVRDKDEWNKGHIRGSQNIYVGHVQEKIAEIPREKPIAVICSVGHRAGIAASVLLRAGFPHVYNVLGSVTAWRNSGFPLIRE